MDTGIRLQTANVLLLNTTVAVPLGNQLFVPLLKKHDGDTPYDETLLSSFLNRATTATTSRNPYVPLRPTAFLHTMYSTYIFA